MDLGGRIALGDDVAGVEDQHQGRMVDLAMNFGQKVAGAADQVGLDLQSVSEVGAMAGLGDLP